MLTRVGSKEDKVGENGVGQGSDFNRRRRVLSLSVT
jgi:hypothetical protein